METKTKAQKGPNGQENMNQNLPIKSVTVKGLNSIINYRNEIITAQGTTKTQLTQGAGSNDKSYLRNRTIGFCFWCPCLKVFVCRFLLFL